MNYKAILGAATLAMAAPMAAAAPFDFGCTDCPITISDGAPDTYLSSIVVGTGGSILDMNVFISIAHTFSGDLDIFLIHEDTGTTVELASDLGSFEDDAYIDTTFDDEAAVNIADATVPFIGTFSPLGLLSDFDGEDLSGTWTLSVTDDFTFDGGELIDWGIFGEVEMAMVSEPGMLALLALGMVGFGFARRKS